MPWQLSSLPETATCMVPSQQARAALATELEAAVQRKALFKEFLARHEASCALM
jgi:hypothetical protein